MGRRVITTPAKKRTGPYSVRVATNPLPAADPAPARNRARPNSLMVSSVDFFTSSDIGPRRPKYPMTRPVRRGPPDAPRLNLAPPGRGITTFAAIIPVAIVSARAQKPKESIFTDPLHTAPPPSVSFRLTSAGRVPA